MVINHFLVAEIVQLGKSFGGFFYLKEHFNFKSTYLDFKNKFNIDNDHCNFFFKI